VSANLPLVTVGCTVKAKIKRHQRILEVLRVKGKVDVTELSETLGVAEMTIRRDLDFFSSEGVLKRVRGGGVAVGSSFEPPFAVRMRESIREKSNIAKVVSELVKDGSTILLDGGTTGMVLAEHLESRVLTIVPLSLRVAARLAGSQTVQLYVPGGKVHQGDQSLIGPDTLEYLQRHRFDHFIMTASGMSVEGGFSDWSPDEAAVKRCAMTSSANVIAAIDSTKYGQNAFASFCSIDSPDLIVTDDRMTDAALGELRSTTTPVVRAGPEALGTLLRA